MTANSNATEAPLLKLPKFRYSDDPSLRQQLIPVLEDLTDRYSHICEINMTTHLPDMEYTLIEAAENERHNFEL